MSIYINIYIFFQIIFSIVAMIVGFQWFVSGAGSSKLSFLSLIISLFSLFTFAVGVSYISFLADKLDDSDYNFSFIPLHYNPSNKEVMTILCRKKLFVFLW